MASIKKNSQHTKPWLPRSYLQQRQFCQHRHHCWCHCDCHSTSRPVGHPGNKSGGILRNYYTIRLHFITPLKVQHCWQNIRNSIQLGKKPTSAISRSLCRQSSQLI